LYTEDLPKRSSKELWNALDSNRLEYYSLSARIKLDYEDAIGKEQATVQIQLIKDSILWISFRKLGIEGGRALITPDSFRIMDRLEDVYYALPYSALSDSYGIDFPFSRLQDLIEGEATLETGKRLRSGMDAGNYLLEGEENGLEHRFGINNLLQLNSLQLSLPGSSKESMKMDLSDYEDVDGQAFAHERKLYISGGMVAQMEAQFSRVRFNSERLNLAFEVPEKFTIYRDLDSLPVAAPQRP
jgi:hypothetical protein